MVVKMQSERSSGKPQGNFWGSPGNFWEGLGKPDSLPGHATVVCNDSEPKMYQKSLGVHKSLVRKIWLYPPPPPEKGPK